MSINSSLISDNLSPHTREELLSRSSRERIMYVEGIRVWYPRATRVLNAIENCHQDNAISAEPQCMMVLGSTGVGKSTLLNSYCSQFQIQSLEETKYVPVVKVTVPAKASALNFATRLLIALDDPLAGIGTKFNHEERCIKFLKDCRTELLVADDVQHFADRDNPKVLFEVSNLLKNLVKEAHLACVIAGLPEAEDVVINNTQFGRLFGDPFLLQPFTWDNFDPSTIEEFRAFLSMLEDLLPLPQPSNLAGMEIAWRCFAATNGRIAYIMNLIRRAAHLAIKQDVPNLNVTLLGQAFDNRLAGQRRRIPNPFIGPIPNLVVEFEAEALAKKPLGRRKS